MKMAFTTCVQLGKSCIEQVLRIQVAELPIDPQLMGALGAAEYARQMGM